jgi:transcription elongation factor Elf1
MSIYENPQQYAKHCHISLDLAIKRCEKYVRKIKLAEKVVCPKCGSHELHFDNDGGDYSTNDFISCTDCWEAYDTDDERLKDWVENYRWFDEVLWFANDISRRGKKQVEKELGEKWEMFVQKSTNEMLSA